MPFTLEQKQRLMRAYAPVLFLHGSEAFVPISPSAYLERSALWNDEGPGSHRRELWGEFASEGGGIPTSAFPRVPLLTPGQLTVDPAAAGGDVRYLGEQVDGAFPFTQSSADRGLFLDFRGWKELDNPIDLANQAGRVQLTTKNRQAFIERLVASWGPFRPEDPSEPMPPEVAMLEPFRRRLSADVHDWISLALAAKDVTLIAMLEKLALQGPTANLWFLFYHFFYPAHLEQLRWCEFVALLKELDKEIPAPLPSGEFLDPGLDSVIGEDLFGLHRADYAGDWSTVCVVVKAPGALPTVGAAQVLPAADADLPPPSYVGLGQRVRSQVSTVGLFTFDQLTKVTDEFGLVGGRHVKVFVGRGTHNNFATPGSHPSPRADSVLDSACDVNGTSDNSDAPIDDRHRKRRLKLLGVLKILLPALLAGPIWPAIGALSLALESLAKVDPSAPFGPDEPTEETTPVEAQAMIIAPEPVLGELGLTAESAWQIEDADLIDGQIWWPPPVGPDSGYRGAWGVTCAEDPFDARSGMPFPDARPRLIESLAIFLEQG